MPKSWGRGRGRQRDRLGNRAFTLEAPRLETYHWSLLFLLGYSGFLSGRTERELEHGRHSDLGKGGPLSSTR